MSTEVRIGQSVTSPDPNWLYNLSHPVQGPKIMTNDKCREMSLIFPDKLITRVLSFSGIEIPFDRWDLLPAPNPEDRLS